MCPVQERVIGLSEAEETNAGADKVLVLKAGLGF